MRERTAVLEHGRPKDTGSVTATQVEEEVVDRQLGVGVGHAEEAGVSHVDEGVIGVRGRLEGGRLARVLEGRSEESEAVANFVKHDGVEIDLATADGRCG